MACFHPLQAYQTSDGSIIFTERKGDVVRSLTLPCGQCRGCRLERSRQWAVRCLWPFGYSSIGDVTFESAAYVARYVMKKRTGSVAGDHYETTDMETGEIKNRVPEFNRMSLKPGIGFDWYKKFTSDVYPNDYVVINGREARPPKFYDRKFAQDFPEEFEALQFQRFIDSVDRFEDNTDERLAVKEKVVEAKFSRLSRSID